MTKPLKYLPGGPFRSIQEFADHIEAGGYVIVSDTGQRVHPGWARSWQLAMCLRGIQQRRLLCAIPNPDHPDNKEKS